MTTEELETFCLASFELNCLVCNTALCYSYFRLFVSSLVFVVQFGVFGILSWYYEQSLVYPLHARVCRISHKSYFEDSGLQ